MGGHATRRAPGACAAECACARSRRRLAGRRGIRVNRANRRVSKAEVRLSCIPRTPCMPRLLAHRCRERTPPYGVLRCVKRCRPPTGCPADARRRQTRAPKHQLFGSFLEARRQALVRCAAHCGPLFWSASTLYSQLFGTRRQLNQWPQRGGGLLRLQHRMATPLVFILRAKSLSGAAVAKGGRLRLVFVLRAEGLAGAALAKDGRLVQRGVLINHGDGLICCVCECGERAERRLISVARNRLPCAT